MVIGLAFSVKLVMLVSNDEAKAVSQVQPVEEIDLSIMMTSKKVTNSSISCMGVMQPLLNGAKR